MIWERVGGLVVNPSFAPGPASVSAPVLYSLPATVFGKKMRVPTVRHRLSATTDIEVIVGKIRRLKAKFPGKFRLIPSMTNVTQGVTTMRIGHHQQRVDPPLAREIGRHKVGEKQKTPAAKHAALRPADGEVASLLLQMRATPEDRTALVEDVKQRLSQGEFSGSESANATAQAIIDQLAGQRQVD